MSTKTESKSGFGAFVAVIGVIVLVAAAGLIIRTTASEDEELVELELEVSWSPRREMDISWRIDKDLGLDSLGEHDRPSWHRGRTVKPGTPWSLITATGSPGKTVCKVFINGNRLADQEVSGLEGCHLSGTA